MNGSVPTSDLPTAAMRSVYLQSGGTSVVAGLPESSLPVVWHWGPDLGELDGPTVAAVQLAVTMPFVDSVVTAPNLVSVLPLHSGGWVGRPGILGARSGAAANSEWSVQLTDVSHEVTATSIRSVGHDWAAGLEVSSELQLLPSGLLRLRAGVRNVGEPGYEVQLFQPALPVPAQAGELLDFTGRHTREHTPQRQLFHQGQWVREAWGGRPGHDSPTVLYAGETGFGFRAGRVWGVHLAWSGNQVYSAEHSATGWKLLRAGENLLPGEVVLDTGQEYVSPWLVAAWGEGLDALSSQFHRHLRSRPGHPSSPRPVLLNVWEAVYFNHDRQRLLDLAERAAAIGVERFVLDDGWFQGRRDDTRGLGDWQVDPDVWPTGLDPLVERVHLLGMQFGLWVEPEMVNLDSNLARTHPDWLLGTVRGPGVASRHQHVLDLAQAGAYEYVLTQISELVERYQITYLKWDHNRPLVDAGHGPSYRPGVHAQTLAVYRLLDELRHRHTGLEIETCAGGGARLDLGILERTDRVWVSDAIDAHERHRLVRWAGLLLPPELMGTHIGAGVDHSTGRKHELAFRAGTAIWGHLGVEWDLAQATPAQITALQQWIALHKRYRSLLHHGVVVRMDHPNPALQVDGVVAQDGSQALFRVSALDHTLTWPPGRIMFAGLVPDARYRVEVEPLTMPSGRGTPEWIGAGVELTGKVLAHIGVQSPLLDVDSLILIALTRCR